MTYGDPTPAGRPAPGAPVPRPLGDLLGELEWRGLLAQATPGLAARLATGRPIAGYNGFDPSGPSLHVGHLIPVFGLLHLQRHGGRPVVVVGGGTGMIGDPSGRSAERNLLTRAQVEANTASIRTQLERFLDFEGPRGAVVVDNWSWLGGLGLLDFLREVGKHFTIPYMLAKDSVQARLEAGLSFTEFSYMLLQAADFLHLNRDLVLGVELQMGGADQWGNITAGLELIRRVGGGSPGPDAAEAAGVPDAAHGLAYPLLLGPDGGKFGKTVEGTSVWLDPARTSPYAFYQFWLDREDAEVGRLLRFFTLLERPAILALEEATRTHPETRAAQRAMADDLTSRVHGPEAAARVAQVSVAVFARTLPALGPEALAFAFAQLPNATLPGSARDGGPLALGVAAGLFASNGDARRTIAQGGYYVNEKRILLEDELPDPLAGGFYVLRSGKKTYRIVRLAD